MISNNSRTAINQRKIINHKLGKSKQYQTKIKWLDESMKWNDLSINNNELTGNHISNI